MSVPRIKTVAVVGCGTIGLSWAALYAVNGLETRVFDADPSAEQRLTAFLIGANDTFTRLKQFEKSPGRNKLVKFVTFTTSLVDAVADADLIQENVPEVLSLKCQVSSRIDELAKPSALIISSTSGTAPSQIQPSLEKHPERYLTGHPFNPPHLVPLVELMPGPGTSASCVEAAADFYANQIVGKKPIVVRKEITGQIAERLQSALLREVFYLLKQGVASVADIDAAIMNGPGLRWGVMGISELFHLGGGKPTETGLGGIESFVDKFIANSDFMKWNNAVEGQNMVIDKPLRDKWTRGTLDMVHGKSYEQLVQERDSGVIEVLNARLKN